MAPLKENLRYHLKKHHKGMTNSVTPRDLIMELFPIRTDIQEIRQLIRELYMEGIPVILIPGAPAHIYYAEDPCISNEKNQP